MKYKESETVELKKSTAELKEAVIAIAAILNKHGKGTIYFGIEDNGKVIGQQIGKLTLKDIARAITDHIDPKIYPDIKVETINKKDYIVVEFSGQETLYSAFGRFYLRAGDENKKLSTKEIERLVAKKRNYVYPWGFQVSETPVSAVNIPAVRIFIKRGRETGRISFMFDTAKNVLNKLHLIKGSKLLNAGKVLFCKENSFEVRAAVFATSEKVTFLDIQLFKGTLFDLINQCEAYVKEHINWRADIVDFKRIETPEIPVKAVREAIVNSLCHRDFNNPAGNEIAIYKNRIEIYNPGQFPYDYSPEDFIRGKEKSLPRNPLIADTFYMTKDIEKWGSGLKRISDECKTAGVKVEFNKIKSGFVVVFYRAVSMLKQIVPAKGGQKGWPERVARKGGQKITSKQSTVLNIIRANPSISRQELADKLGINVSAVRKHLDALRRKGLLKRVGPDKGGHWEAVKDEF